MAQESIQTQNPEFLDEVLRTLPVPITKHGVLHYRMLGVPRERTLETIAKCAERSVIPFQDVSFRYDYSWEVFQVSSAMYPPHPSEEGSEEPFYRSLLDAALKGRNPHQYIINLAGLGKNFAFDQLQQDILEPLRRREYEFTLGEIWLGTYQSGPDSGMYSPSVELVLKPGTAFIRSDNSFSPNILTWFSQLKEKYHHP